MRILDDNGNKSLNSIVLLLTNNEINEFKSCLDRLLNNEEDHIHIDDEEYNHEIILSMYSNENLNSFSERIQKLICTDE